MAFSAHLGRLSSLARSWRTLVVPAGVVAYVLVAGTLLIGPWGPDGDRELFGDVLAMPLGLLAALGALRRGLAMRDQPRARRPWFLLAGAYASALLGSLAWLVGDLSSSGPAVEQLGLGLILAGYLPLVGGLLSLPRDARARRDRLRLALDGAIVAIGAGLLLWYFLLRRSESFIALGLLEALAAFAVPIADMAVIVVLVVVLIRGVEPGLARTLHLLAAGHALDVATRLLTVHLAIANHYQAGDPVDAGWLVAGALTALGAWGISRGGQAPSTATPSLKPSLIPYAFILIAYATLGSALRPYLHTALGAVVVVAFVLTALLVVRQFVAQLD
ncbi:MAG TPA: hypothetical protein VEA99_12165, partial [Gemmatimonadaceae bacterium]|nr:hypothetical protein [Gemmatimonadaceae bacterium]